MTAVIATGVAAAALVGLGFVIQQRVAASQPPSDRLRFRLLVHLARRPLWLAGICVMIVGQLLGATALGEGDLGLVEPLLTSSLLFALAISAGWKRQRLAIREWVGAATLAGGLSGFVIVARPSGGDVFTLPWPNWAISIGVILLCAGSLVGLSRRLPAVPAARRIGAAAGIMFGLQDALTRRTLAVVPHGGADALFTQWPTYLLAAVGLGSLLLSQSAFEAAPLDASLPPMTFAEPLTGIAFGAGVFGERLSLEPWAIAVEVLCLAAAAAGVWLVAASPMLAPVSTARDVYPGRMIGREPEWGATATTGDAGSTDQR